jgi:plastocyanin domain-containing protein
MNFSNLLLPPVAALALVASPLAVAMDHGHAGHDHENAAAAGSHAAAKAAKDAQVVELTVTKEGFEPSAITVKQGKPVKLVVTRKVDKTCATEIVMKDLGVHQPLPLNKPVTVKVTPKRPGEYRFACGMDMVAGVLKVE